MPRVGILKYADHNSLRYSWSLTLIREKLVGSRAPRDGHFCLSSSHQLPGIPGFWHDRKPIIYEFNLPFKSFSPQWGLPIISILTDYLNFMSHKLWRTCDYISILLQRIVMKDWNSHCENCLLLLVKLTQLRYSIRDYKTFYYLHHWVTETPARKWHCYKVTQKSNTIIFSHSFKISLKSKGKVTMLWLRSQDQVNTQAKYRILNLVLTRSWEKSQDLGNINYFELNPDMVLNFYSGLGQALITNSGPSQDPD